MQLRKVLMLVVVALLATLAPTVAAGASGGEYGGGHGEGEATYTVTVRNLTAAQPLTPPNWAAHDDDVDVFQRRHPASPGVQAVAENGGVAVLEAELLAAVDDAGNGVSGVGAEAPIGPGASATFDFTTDERRFSLVAMVVCTNDGFAGLDSVRLPRRDGQTRIYRARAYDAGTELNTEMRADLVPVGACGPGDGTGMSNPELAENGVIRPHRSLLGVGDLDPALDWTGPVAEVTITRHDPAPTYTIELENLTEGQPLTPPNWAVHDRTADVFQNRTPAPAYLQGLAENGDVDGVATALSAAVDGTGAGVSGVVDGGPLLPGERRTIEVTAEQRRLSIVSMVVCTNDGFAGLDAKRLPRHDGQTRTFYVRAYDAGTELNTEMRADLVPVGACGPGDGTGMSNPELAENGVIRRHRTLQGVGDLDPSLDWEGPVLKVTVTRN
ncbi:MAG: spondin domain-containing protein [Actinomycetota bacterium]